MSTHGRNETQGCGHARDPPGRRKNHARFRRRRQSERSPGHGGCPRQRGRRRTMTLARAAGVILAKELRTEFRSRELLGTTARLRSDCDRPLQLYVQSDVVGIAPLRSRTSVARVSVCRLADVAIFFFARADQRHAGRAAPGPDRSVQHSGGEDGRQFSVPASG